MASEKLTEILETLDSALSKAVDDLEWLEGDTSYEEADVCFDWVENLEHLRGLINDDEEES